MEPSQRRGWPIAFLAILAAAPANFLLGMGGASLLQKLRGPPMSGEGVMANAYEALFIGAPLGLVIGSVLVGWLSLKFAPRMNALAVALLVGVLAGTSACIWWATGPH